MARVRHQLFPLRLAALLLLLLARVVSPRRLLYDYWGDDEQSPEPEPGGVPASACSRSAALALYEGYPGVCMTDVGCMSIQLGQLDAACPEMYSMTPSCSQPCYAVLASIGASCRQELLGSEEARNNRFLSIPGGTATWLWYTLFGTCGLTGPGGTWEEPPQASPSPVPEEPPPESPEPEEPPPPLPSPSPRITLNPLPANWSGSSADLLLAFKSSFLNGEAALSDWTSEEGAVPCDWPGVRCNSMEEVTGIYLNGTGLEGEIAEDSWHLPPTLEELSLAGNALNGTIPAVTGMPSSLVFLSLADNQLTGSMPWRWDLPDGLQVLMLQGNDLEGGVITYPNLESCAAYIHPGNPNLCGPSGDVPPPQPEFYTYSPDGEGTLIKRLPSCEVLGFDK